MADNILLLGKIQKITMTRRRSLKFHIAQDDYFGTLATMLDLTVQTVERDLKLVKQLKQCCADLQYLQKQYKIVSNRKGKE